MALVVVLDEVAVVNRTDAELTLDGRDERRALEERTSERLDRARELALALDRRVQADEADVLLSRRLLRLDKPSRAVDADDEAPRDLWVQRARVAGLLDAKDAAEPGHDLVRRRVRGLVQVDHTVPDVLLDLALERGAARRNRRVVTRAHVERVVVAQEQGPLRGVEARRRALRLDHKAIRGLLEEPGGVAGRFSLGHRELR